MDHFGIREGSPKQARYGLEIQAIKFSLNFFHVGRTILLNNFHGGIMAQPEPTAPKQCLIWGYLCDAKKTAIASASVIFSLVNPKNTYTEAAGRLIAKAVTVQTDALGYFEANLISSSEFEGDGRYLVEIKQNTEFDAIYAGESKIIINVPDTGPKNITELILAS